MQGLIAQIEHQEFCLTWASSYDQALLATNHPNLYDVYILDYRLGANNGIEILERLIERGCRAPIIMLTAQTERELDVQAMQAGAADFLNKSRVDRDSLERSIRYSIGRKISEEALQRARDELEMRVMERTSELVATNKELRFEMKKREVIQEKLERAQDRLSFFDKANRTLMASLDYQKILAQLSEVIVPGLADWCSVDMVNERGQIKRLAVANSEQMDTLLAKRLEQYYPRNPKLNYGVAQVIKTGQAELYSTITPELLRRAARNRSHFEILSGLKLHSGMVVPLVARGKTIGAITLVISHSDRKYNEEDLFFAEELAMRAALVVDNARLYRESQVANQAKDEFLATLQHELRTPLNAIVGWSELLSSMPFEEKTFKDGLQIIRRNALAQTSLIDDVLDVSRVITGKLDIQGVPTDLKNIIEGVRDSFILSAQSKEIHLNTELDDSVGLILADPTRIQQIVWNLLSNAIKFTPHGGEVTIKVGKGDGKAIIEVKDSGPGIAKDFLPHVFDRFSQEDGSLTRKYGGLGLGLAIVRHLTELHGGEVAAESAGKGQGATFIIRLPLYDPTAVTHLKTPDLLDNQVIL